MKDRKVFDAYIRNLELLDLEIRLRIFFLRVKVALLEYQLKFLALFD